MWLGIAVGELYWLLNQHLENTGHQFAHSHFPEQRAELHPPQLDWDFAPRLF